TLDPRRDHQRQHVLLSRRLSEGQSEARGVRGLHPRPRDRRRGTPGQAQLTLGTPPLLEHEAQPQPRTGDAPRSTLLPPQTPHLRRDRRRTPPRRPARPIALTGASSATLDAILSPMTLLRPRV